MISGQSKEDINYTPTDSKDNSAEWTELKFVNNPIFQLSNEIDLYGNDKIALIMFNETEMMGLLIKSKMLYTTLNSLFDLTRNREENEAHEK
ncbi:MAG: hypothetical protein LBH96_02900 [Candidatus Peribacteria bacterium]|nr:hypothetical protein [Candidatus Peribacteria bacterium]